MKDNILYFDHNATTPLVEGLVEKIKDWAVSCYANPSSVHQLGRKAKTLIEDSRKTHLSFLNAPEKSKLIFTSGGTEANNMLLQSSFRKRGAKNKLIISSIEHSCIANTADFLKKQGCDVVQIPVNTDGEFDFDFFEKELTDDVFLVSVMLVNNETGFVLPVKKIAELCRKKNIPVHTDAVCAIAKMTVDMTDLGVDFLSFSSHKFGALKGCGGLVMAPAARLDSFIFGGPQEAEKRSGTENVLGILASGFAIEYHSAKNLESKIKNWIGLREQFKKIIQTKYPKSFFIESKTEQLAQTISVCFKDLSGVLLLTNLDLEGVCASYGSACASGALEVSRVIKNLGVPFSCATSVVRFSLGHETSSAEIEMFQERFALAVERATT